MVFAVGGIAFPIGVLFYWTTSNLWTMCQQFYVIRNNPAPGTPAAKAKQDRDAAKRKRKGLPDPRRRSSRPARGDARAPARQQPKKQTRSQRKKPRRPVQPEARAKPGDEGDEPGRNSA